MNPGLLPGKTFPSAWCNKSRKEGSECWEVPQLPAVSLENPEGSGAGAQQDAPSWAAMLVRRARASVIADGNQNTVCHAAA